MNKNFIRLNVAFKPPEDITKRIIALSQEIGKNNEPIFVLDGIKFYPHITVYSPEYPKKNLNQVLKVTEEVVKKTSKIKIKFQQITSGQGFISLSFELSPKIKRFHEEVVEKLNPLREGHIREKYQPGSDYQVRFSSEQKENITTYGYPDAMTLYHPHLTIIRLQDESLAKTVARNLNWKIPQFTVDKIGIYKMGEHGTCRELVGEFTCP